MSKLRKIMNDQLGKTLTEIEALEHSAERTKLRIMLIGALANTASISFKETTKGKDAIKEDTAKEVDQVVEENDQVDETELDYTGTLCSVCGEPQFNTTSGVTCANGHGGAEPMSDQAQEENDQVTEENNQVEETTEEVQEEEITMATEPLVVLNEEGQEVDITDAYNSIFYAANDEERQMLALQVTEFMCLPAYQTLNELVVLNKDGEEELLADSYSKFMLAYYMTPSDDPATGVEAVDGYVSQFTDGQITTLAEFINNENIDAFIEWLSN